jgi:hypothetical protein
VGTAYTVYGWVTNSYGQSDSSEPRSPLWRRQHSAHRHRWRDQGELRYPIIHFKSSEDGSIVMASADQTTVNISRDYGLTWELTAYLGAVH